MKNNIDHCPFRELGYEPSRIMEWFQRQKGLKMKAFHMFGERLKKAREWRGLSVPDCSEMLKISDKLWLSWESGCVPGPDEVSNVCKLLNIQLHWLLTGVKEPGEIPPLDLDGRITLKIDTDNETERKAARARKAAPARTEGASRNSP